MSATAGDDFAAMWAIECPSVIVKRLLLLSKSCIASTVTAQRNLSLKYVRTDDLFTVRTQYEPLALLGPLHSSLSAQLRTRDVTTVLLASESRISRRALP